MLKFIIARVTKKHLIFGAFVEDDIGTVCLNGFDGNFITVCHDHIAGSDSPNGLSIKAFAFIQGQGHDVPFLIVNIGLYHPAFQVVDINRYGLGLDCKIVTFCLPACIREKVRNPLIRM